MTPKDLEVLYGLLLKKDYHSLFEAFIVVTLGTGSRSRIRLEGEDKLAIEALEKIVSMKEQTE